MSKKVLSIIFLILGIFFIFQGLFDLSKRLGYYKSPTVLSTVSQIETSSTPTFMTINSLNLNLPVEPTLINNGKWPTSQSGISFLENSGTLGKSGNLIFYGHNWKTLLGSLQKIKVGDNIVLKSSTGQDFQYSVALIAEVNPNDVSVLEDTSDERITLYTCTGLLDQKRLVVVAKRV